MLINKKLVAFRLKKCFNISNIILGDERYAE